MYRTRATAWPRCLSRDGVARPDTGDPRPHTSAVPTRSQCQGATLAVVAACRNCGACCLRSLPCDGGAQRCCSPRSFAGAMTEARWSSKRRRPPGLEDALAKGAQREDPDPLPWCVRDIAQ